MSYSLDFRKHVMGLKKAKNLTYVETSKRFGLSVRTLFRWHTRLEPHVKRNKPSTKINMLSLAKDV